MVTITEISSFVAFYFVIWWLVLLIVLPIGIRSEQQPQIGHDRGAPAKPNLKRKAITVSVVSLIISIMWAVAVQTGVLDFGVLFDPGTDWVTTGGQG